jgi:hypothetical protein
MTAVTLARPLFETAQDHGAPHEVLAHLVVGALLDVPLAEDLVVPRLRAAEERRQVGEVFVDRRLQGGLALGRLDQLGGEILAELRMEALLRHGGARQVSQRMEGAVQQVLDLQDLGEVG